MDAAGFPRSLRPDRDREIPGEEQIPLDPHAEGQPDPTQLFQAPRAEFGVADIGQAEHDVAALIQLGGEPDARAEGIEEFDDGDVIGAALPAIGEELRTLGTGQEDHAAILRSVPMASASSPSAKARI